MARKVLMGEYWKIHLVISFLVDKVYLPHFLIVWSIICIWSIIRIYGFTQYGRLLAPGR